MPIESSNILVALVVRLGGILEITSVLDGNFVSNLGDSSVALLENSLGNTHGC